MSLSNALWYEGLLACGTEDIANATCANGCPRINQLSNLCLSAKAHQSIISEKLLDSVIFLNTAEVSLEV